MKKPKKFMLVGRLNHAVSEASVNAGSPVMPKLIQG
jgi:hypothetical protein